MNKSLSENIQKNNKSLQYACIHTYTDAYIQQEMS